MLKKILFTVHNSLDCLARQSRKSAFTLAETLIVMGIIGVVAALTLPNLNSSTGDKEKVAKVKKIYQNLNDAFGRAEAVYGPLDEWCVNPSGDYCNTRTFERITEFMKYSKKCTISDNCSFKYDKNGSGGTNSKHAVLLADGSMIEISTDRANNNIRKVGFTIDIDGVNKGANKQGYDVFKFYANHEKGVYAGNIFGGSIKYPYRFAGDSYYYFATAAAWVINFDNMDYLKTPDGTTCPDGKTKLSSDSNHSCN